MREDSDAGGEKENGENGENGKNVTADADTAEPGPKRKRTKWLPSPRKPSGRVAARIAEKKGQDCVVGKKNNARAEKLKSGAASSSSPPKTKNARTRGKPAPLAPAAPLETRTQSKRKVA